MAKLVVLIITETEKALDIAEQWQSQGGATGVTIIDSHGIGSLMKASKSLELPLFVSMASVLHQIQEANQLIFSVVEDDKVDTLVEIAQLSVGELIEPNKGIMFVVPVERVIGLKPHIQS